MRRPGWASGRRSRRGQAAGLSPAGSSRSREAFGRPPPLLQGTALSHAGGPPWSPTARPPQPRPPPHLRQGVRVASRRGCSWMPPALGSRPESRSRRQCPPRAARCWGHEGTLKEEAKTRGQSLPPESREGRHLGRSWGRFILTRNVFRKSCRGHPGARGGRGATGGVVQGRGAQRVGTGHEWGKSTPGRVGPLGSPVYAVTSVGGPSPEGQETLSHTWYRVAGCSPSSS